MSPRDVVRKWPRWAAAALVLLARCTDLNAVSPDVRGAWVGTYVEGVVPARALGARLQLTQVGVNVTGTLILVNGRTADASGTLIDRRLSLGFRYTDACTGTARWTLDLSADGSELSGTAESFDCRGDTRADVTIERQ